MKILKSKLNHKVLIAILGVIVLNLAVLDLFILDSSLADKTKFFFAKKIEVAQREQIFEQVNPSQGYDLNVKYSDLGPRMVSMGVIDLTKFGNIEKLTEEQTNILTKGSDQKIKIDRENSHFLLNFFWALGLANNSKILTDGQMQKYGGNPGNFASTGGWTLSKDSSMSYYSKGELIKLTPQQESLVQNVALNIYRPCCDNSTAFPDCNHGMALLGVLELLASNNASEKQMYEAAKYINAYWFPTNYLDLAKYFKLKDGQDFSKVDPKLILGKDYSSVSGYSAIKKWLEEKEGTVQNTGGGSSCGVR